MLGFERHLLERDLSALVQYNLRQFLPLLFCTDNRWNVLKVAVVI